jgi:acyl-coenzyme A synthetase/AMP-(fatty) acid ligase
LRAGVRTFVDWAATAAGLTEHDRVCSPAPLHFDLSVFDIFAACQAAACLTVLPDGAATFPVSIARWLEAERMTLDQAGNYAYLGRRDSMVKVRGYRIELGEVEATLYRHPAIREAAVLPVPDELLGNRLRAVVTADGACDLTREDVLDHCRQWLPGYMVPDIVEFREGLPRTSTGKVDRAGLTKEQHEQLEPAGDGRANGS